MQRNQPENARQGARYDGIDELDPNFNGAGVRVGIVMARFNLDICEGLLSACTDELLALGVARGDIAPERETLVRVHEPISVVDFLDPASNRHSFPVNDALATLAGGEAGVIVLLYRPMSGRELLASLNGTNDRPVKWDARLFGVGAQILRTLKVGKMRLLASPRKIPSMTGFGLEITGFVDKN